MSSEKSGQGNGVEKGDGLLHGHQRMGDERAAMGGGHPLGEPRRSRGVEDVGDVVWSDLRPELTAVPVDQIGPVVLARSGGPGTEDEDPGAVGPERRQRPGPVELSGTGHDDRRPAVGDHVFELPAGHPRVDGDGHRPGLQDGEVSHLVDGGAVVPDEQSHPVAPLHPGGDQTPGHRVRPGLPFGVGHLAEGRSGSGTESHPQGRPIGETPGHGPEMVRKGGHGGQPWH